MESEEYTREIILRSMEYPNDVDLLTNLNYFSNSMGIKNKDEIKVFLFLLLKSKYGKGVSLEEINKEIDMPINKMKVLIEDLLKKGLIRCSRDLYILRENNLSITIDSIFTELNVIAQNIKRASVVVDRKATKNNMQEILENWKNEE